MLPEMEQPGTPYLRPEQRAAWYADGAGPRRDWRHRGKWWLTGAAAALSLGYLLYLAARGEEAALAAGPLSPAHAREAVACSQCHTGWFRPAARLVWSEARSVHDADCAACHQSQAAPPYHHEQAADTACAVCHREHRGRDSLSWVPDGHCTRCHARLHRLDGSPSALADVSAFAEDHPQFRPLTRPDPGRLRFHHAVHLDAEGVLTLSGQRQRLTCQDCHHPREAGCYFSLPRYETCQQCHPIHAALPVSFASEHTDRINLPDQEVQEAVRDFARQPLPHKEPSEVRSEVVRRLRELVRRFPRLREQPPSDPVAPSHPERAWPAEAVLDEESWVALQQRQIERQLFLSGGGCRFCHVPDAGAVARAAQGELPHYHATNLTAVWLPMARFSHAVRGHRERDCAECHAAVTSRDSADVLVPGVDSCRTCHAPGRPARYDCSECHRYHQASQRRGTCGQSQVQGRRVLLGAVSGP